MSTSVQAPQHTNAWHDGRRSLHAPAGAPEMVPLAMALASVLFAGSAHADICQELPRCSGPSPRVWAGGYGFAGVQSCERCNIGGGATAQCAIAAGGASGEFDAVCAYPSALFMRVSARGTGSPGCAVSGGGVGIAGFSTNLIFTRPGMAGAFSVVVSYHVAGQSSHPGFFQAAFRSSLHNTPCGAFSPGTVFDGAFPPVSGFWGANFPMSIVVGTDAGSGNPPPFPCLGTGFNTVTFEVTGIIVRDANNQPVSGFVVHDTATNHRVWPPCASDVDDGGGTGTPDGGVTIDDLLYYLRIFEDGAIAADVDDGSNTGTPDGGVTIDDLLYYLVRFEAGC